MLSAKDWFFLVCSPRYPEILRCPKYHYPPVLHCKHWIFLHVTVNSGPAETKLLLHLVTELVPLARFRVKTVPLTKLLKNKVLPYYRWRLKEFYTVFDLCSDFKDSLVCDLHSDVSFCFFLLWPKQTGPLEGFSVSRDVVISLMNHSLRRWPAR